MTYSKSTGSVVPGSARLAVDTGGTFTDFLFYDGARLQVLKLPSTPAAPEQAVLEGAAKLSSNPAGLAMVHGSTVATNALLERKLARTAYITNTGLADLLTIGRQARAELYNLQPAPQAPPVPAEYCFEIDQRTNARGEEIRALDSSQIQSLVARLQALAPQAVAINLLFSFSNDAPEHALERALAQALCDGLHISRSSAVLPEYREYERGIATWLNAALAPRMQNYLCTIERNVGHMTVMQSAAGTADASQAAGHSVQLLLSGPAGGLLGARYIGRLAGCQHLLSFDMGGTSTDVALIDSADDGPLRLTSEARIAGYPVAVPMVDMHTIGAGGGSIAFVDAGGMLCVGPESAGADPGPACYGKGGDRATVTDANVLLGRLPASSRLGGGLPLDAAASRAAISELAAQIQRSPEQTAQGIIEIANEAMAKALRVISVERGEDTNDFTLLSFGGAGGLHVCALADAMRLERALVPVYAGVLSALGMLVARRARFVSKSLLKPLPNLTDAAIDRDFELLYQQGCAELEAEGVSRQEIASEYSLDLRYQGQSFSLNLAWRGTKDAEHAFHRAHETRYGHALELPVEVVNLRLVLQGPKPEITLEKIPSSSTTPTPETWVEVYGCRNSVPLYLREDLKSTQRIHGPAIIREPVATTWLAENWSCTVDPYGNLLLGRT